MPIVLWEKITRENQWAQSLAIASFFPSKPGKLLVSHALMSGYGVMNPGNVYANIIVTIESYVFVIWQAGITGMRI